MPPKINDIAGQPPAVVFFRNDDVNELTPELIKLTELFFDEGIPIIHAIEPGNVTRDCVDWLLEQKAEHGRLLEIIQHGYNHTKHCEGEFGGDRNYEEQFEDLKRGQDLMDDRFGDQWFRGMNFPYGPYNPAALRAVGDLSFLVFNGYFNPRLSRRLFYRFGHMLDKGMICGRHVSHHLDNYPGTDVLSIDMSISYIDNFYGHYGSADCDWFTNDELLSLFDKTHQHNDVIGWLLHHRYHVGEESYQLVRNSIAGVRERIPGVEFWNFEEIFELFGKRRAELSARP